MQLVSCAYTVYTRPHSDDSAKSLYDERVESAFYERVLRRAFEELEQQVAQGNIQFYGVSGAFYPLRESEPQHLLLARLVEIAGPHFKVIQFPLNFAEIQPLVASQVARKADGGVFRKEDHELLPLVALAEKHSICMLSNRPLNGIYKEARGVCRFSSSVPMNSQFQAEDVDQLEFKLSQHLTLPQSSPSADAQDEDGYGDQSVTGQLSGKSMTHEWQL